ncbi:MAG: hypothetical protein HUJ98_14860, partial [Bacteroidaceae bacterium]|nr:hypothetical protein [Bacteroidaceae bacterium]
MILLLRIVFTRSYAVAIACAMAAAWSVAGVYKLACEMISDNNQINTLVASVYGVSFSQLIFSSYPDSYVFAGCIHVWWWVFVAHILKQSSDELKIREAVGIVLFGIASFGITVTNYAFYLVGLAVLLICKRKSVFESFKSFCVFNIINLAAIVVTTLVQFFLYKRSTVLWWEYIGIVFDKSSKMNELRFVGQMSLAERLALWADNVFVMPLFGSGYDFYVFDYGNYNVRTFAPLMNGQVEGIIGAAVFMAALSINVYFMFKNRRLDWLTAGILVDCVGNLCFHIIYGADEAFLYSQHFWFMSVLMLTNAVVQLCGEKTVVVCMIFGALIVMELQRNGALINSIISDMRLIWGYEGGKLKAMLGGVLTAD